MSNIVFFDKAFIDEDVAICLYLGLATDSGIFRYKSTNRKTFLMAAELIGFGFDFTKLLDTIVFENSLSQRKAQGIAFNRLKLLCKGKVSFSYLTQRDLDELNLKKNDIDNIIVYLREMENIKIAEVCGLCAGCTRAINTAVEEIKKGKSVTIFKEIVHNKNVNS